MTLLALESVHADYGAEEVLHGVSLAVEDGSVVALLGANGAGKTTTLRAISRTVSARGEIRFNGCPLLAKRPEDVARRGIAHVPEGRGIVTQLTLEENLRLGSVARRASNGVAEDLDQCFARFPRLAERRRQPAASLSGGEQQMLAVCRALLARPRLLLLDEPSLGLAPKTTRELFGFLRELRADLNMAMLIVEQNAELVLDFADMGYVLETGAIVLQGTADELRGSGSVQRAYLGY